MATTERDYYDVLGVPRNATEAEIKRAFRALAREVHPDVSQEPDAEQRFREVAEAYEVLSDPERRALYDRYGHAGLRGGGFQPGTFDFGSLSDLFSAFFGDDLIGGGGRRARGADLHAVSLVGATYGIRSTPLGAVGLVGPLRMDYEKAIRTVRAAAFELSRFVEDVYEDV